MRARRLGVPLANYEPRSEATEERCRADEVANNRLANELTADQLVAVHP